MKEQTLKYLQKKRAELESNIETWHEHLNELLPTSKKREDYERYIKQDKEELDHVEWIIEIIKGDGV